MAEASQKDRLVCKVFYTVEEMFPFFIHMLLTDATYAASRSNSVIANAHSLRRWVGQAMLRGLHTYISLPLRPSLQPNFFNAKMTVARHIGRALE
jgi:hypothetical protein